MEEPEKPKETEETALPEPRPEPRPEPAGVMDLAARLAEAEMRGYKRGLNEQIAARMAAPALYEPLASAGRRSVWDD